MLALVSHNTLSCGICLPDHTEAKVGVLREYQLKVAEELKLGIL